MNFRSWKLVAAIMDALTALTVGGEVELRPSYRGRKYAIRIQRLK